MKKQFLLGILLLFFMAASAQKQLGPAGFSVPDGWEMTGSDNLVTLKKPARKGVVCTITISLAQKGTVSTSADYINYRGKNSYPGVSYSTAKGAVTKYEANGLTSFFSRGTVSVGAVSAHNYFYSLSNGSQTLHYQLLTSDNTCVQEFNQFMSTLTMETPDKAPSNARARRKAAPAAPAAPAPMM